MKHLESIYHIPSGSCTRIPRLHAARFSMQSTAGAHLPRASGGLAKPEYPSTPPTPYLQAKKRKKEKKIKRQTKTKGDTFSFLSLLSLAFSTLIAYCLFFFPNPQTEEKVPLKPPFQFTLWGRDKSNHKLTLFLFCEGPSYMPTLHLQHHLQRKRKICEILFSISVFPCKTFNFSIWIFLPRSFFTVPCPRSVCLTVKKIHFGENCNPSHIKNLCFLFDT